MRLYIQETDESIPLSVNTLGEHAFDDAAYGVIEELGEEAADMWYEEVCAALDAGRVRGECAGFSWEVREENEFASPRS